MLPKNYFPLKKVALAGGFCAIVYCDYFTGGGGCFTSLCGNADPSKLQSSEAPVPVTGFLKSVTGHNFNSKAVKSGIGVICNLIMGNFNNSTGEKSVKKL